MGDRWTDDESRQGRMMRERRTFYVYIMSNRSRTLYIGITNDLERRVSEHRARSTPGFTQKYNCTRLVYLEEHGDPSSAIAREKALKGWLRRRKLELIEELNPDWDDLAADWFELEQGPSSR